MMFYDRTLSSRFGFTVEDITKWSVKEISKEEYFDKFDKLCHDIKYQLNDIEEVKPKWHYVTDKLPPNPISHSQDLLFKLTTFINALFSLLLSP